MSERAFERANQRDGAATTVRPPAASHGDGARLLVGDGAGSCDRQSACDNPWDAIAPLAVDALPRGLAAAP